jgi:hypothetical protein
MISDELRNKIEQESEKSRYLVAYLAKLYAENPSQNKYTVTLIKKGQSDFVIDVNGHTIDFKAQ